MNDHIAIYQNGEIEIEASVESETIWLTQKQIAVLFEVTVANVNIHIKTIYNNNELDKLSTIKKYLIVQKEGNRNISRNIEHYNLDVVISVGYRVNSIKATKFRQWATSVLKEYIFGGYAVNREKITQQRLMQLEHDVESIKEHITNNTLDVKQGIFYDGQVFDAYVFVSDIIKSAKHSIKLVDNYIDESVLTLFSKNQNIQVTIYTKNISKQLKLDLEKYNTQYNPIEVKQFDASHDRFLIIDESEVYHIGASLKDLGKKWFAFSKMSGESLGLMGKLV
jgi:hypothetical protein